MRRQIGFLLQLAVLTLLPLVIVWQLNFDIPYVWMPILTLLGVFLFMAGTKLREG
ncbi:MAG: hypothetical protein QF363_14075 [Planctomycetaceae bacterium]|jgi:hypothetical protein|nr:hypothetical protein [Planctomycetaceae bacterium]